jgi:hypothetical protein
MRALPGFSIHEPLSEFRRQFQELHENSPLRAIKLFFLYLESRGLDDSSRAMAFFSTSGNTYISLLLDAGSNQPETLSVEGAVKIIPLLISADPQFLFKFATSLAALTDPASILGGLTLVPALGDYSIMIPWLRSLSAHSDTRVCSRAAKLLCQLRPSKGLIDRYLQSHDARVRAAVMEALWNPKAIHVNDVTLHVLRSAVADPHHRVAINALVGLYRLGEIESLHKLLALCSSKQHLFRAATAWALGAIQDSRAIPALRKLTLDHSFTVRQQAANSLTKVRHLHP